MAGPSSREQPHHWVLRAGHTDFSISSGLRALLLSTTDECSNLIKTVPTESQGLSEGVPTT